MKNKQVERKDKLVLMRHKIVFAALRPFFKLYFKIKYNFSYDKYCGVDKDVLILSNHATTLDPFFLAASFDFPIYFVASDQIFNLGFVSRIIKYLVSPIPKMKGVSDLQTIKDIYAVSKAGGAVGIFPEGNRTFTGKTCNIPDQIGKLVKLLKKTVVVYNLEGGYLSKPRFSGKVRRGKMVGKIKAVWTISDYEKLSPDEIYQNLKKELYVDAYETEKAWDIEYKTSRGAEFLENILYFCPKCKRFHTFKSRGNFYTCANCGAVVEYTQKGYLKSDDENIPFQTVEEWSTWQNEYIIQNKLFENHIDKPLISNNTFKLYKSVRGKKREYVDAGTLSLYSDRYEFDGKDKLILKIDEIQDVAPQTMGKIQMYMKNDEMLIFRGDERSYSLSFVTLFYMIKNAMEGKGNEFLGF
ncbi:MAG: 1-acyl-sn-glycerol-3-phosphate acyltransferase [Clostridia bacterium]